MPNRGKRDKIKDIFKYDDLFYPNRGKRDLKNIFKNNDDLFFPNRGKKQMKNANDMQRYSDSDNYLLHNSNNNYDADDGDNDAAAIDALPIAMAFKSGRDIKDLIVKIKRKLQQLQNMHHQQQEDGQSMLSFQNILDNEMAAAIKNNNNERDNAVSNSNSNDYSGGNNNNNITPPTGMSTSFQSLNFLQKRFKPMANILQQRNRYQQLNSYNARRQQQWGKRYGSKGNRNQNDNNAGNVKNAAAAAALRSGIYAAAAKALSSNKLPAWRSMSNELSKLQPANAEKTFDNHLSSATTPLIAKFMWRNTPQNKNLASNSLATQYDPWLWYKLQLLQQQSIARQPSSKQYHQALMTTMQHSPLTALQHLQNNFDQPPPYSSASLAAA